MLNQQTINTIKALGKKAGQEFFKEFNEILNPTRTNWGVKAWETDSCQINKEDRGSGWAIYEEALIVETRRLVKNKFFQTMKVIQQ